MAPLTDVERRILDVFKDGAEHLYSAEIMDRTGLSAGQMYPALLRLELRGDVASRWVDALPPRRRVYWKHSQAGDEA